MNDLIKNAVLVLLVTLSSALLSPARASGFAVESFEKYDQGATSYTVPASVNFAIVKKASSDFVVWTLDDLTTDQLTVIESYARAHDASLQDRNAIFVSGMGSHTVNNMYGTITFAYDADGLAVLMPREWSHLDYGSYTDLEPVPDPETTGSLTITKTVSGQLWRVRCDYMDVTNQSTYNVLPINGCHWKRDYIKNPGGNTSREGHRDNKCGDAEHWVIWADQNGVAYRMDEIKSGATGGTLSTVVYSNAVYMTDNEIANIGNPDRPECLSKYKENFQTTMPYSDIRINERLYWITFNAGQVWYHTGIPYETEPSFIIYVDGVPYILTGGQTVTIPDLEPGIHEISEAADPLYSLGTVVSSKEGAILSQNGWTVQIQVNAGEQVDVTWPNVQPDPRDPPTPPTPPGTDPDPDPAVTNVTTLCELLDFGKRFNAVVFGDLTTTGGDSEGNLLVWGNATLPAGYSIGYAVVGEATPPAGNRNDALIVAGDLNIGNQSVNGNVVYGGTYFGTNRTWAGYALRHVVPVTLDRSGNVPADGSGRTAADLLAAAVEVSERVGEMEANGTVTTDENGSLVLSGTNTVRNIFAVTAEEWSGSGRDWIFDVPAGSKVIVNVVGDLVELVKGRMVLPEGMTRADMLVNYVNATHLSFSSIDHEGSVLAPYASGSFSGGAINGIAMLGGNVVTKSGFEFHNFGLDVFFCPPMPEIVVAATAASAGDGDVWAAEPGSDVQMSIEVRNPSVDFWLRNVKLTDSNGSTVSLGELAPGGTTNVTLVLTSEDAGLVSYSATATAWAYGTNGVAFANRPTVSASDIAAVLFEANAGAGFVAAGYGAAGNAGSAGSPVFTALADYKVEDMWFSCVPTFAGEQFTVNVRVKNNGDADGDGAFLGLYLVGIDHEVTIADGEEIDPVRTVEMGTIPAQGSRVYSFGGLTAPDTNGTCRVIAYADMDNIQHEWSKGDNQNNLTYELSQVAIHIDVSAEGVTLTWSNGWGQIYAILGSTDLEHWTEIEHTENWDDEIGGIPSFRDTKGLVENSEFVSFDTGYNFFKLRVKQR